VASTPLSPADWRRIAQHLLDRGPLPLLPVIRISGIAKARGASRPRAGPCNARIGGPTSAWRLRPPLAGTRSLAATAPGCERRAANSAVKTLASDTDKQIAWDDVAAIGGHAHEFRVPPTRRAPSACAATDEVKHGRPPRQTLPDLRANLGIVERRRRHRFLIGFVAFASEHTTSCGAGGRRSPAGFAVAPILFYRVFRVRAGEDFVDDRARILGPRVVTGNYHAVGQTGRHFPHSAGVSPDRGHPATENAMHFPSFEKREAQGLQHLLQRVWGVRVIHHHQAALRVRAPFAAVPAPARPATKPDGGLAAAHLK